MEITAIRNPEPCRKHSRILLFSRGVGVVEKKKGREKKRWRGRKKKYNQQQQKINLKKGDIVFPKRRAKPLLNPNPEEEKPGKASLPEHHLRNRRFSEE